MISSRKLEDLHPTVHQMADTFLDKAKAAGIDVLVTCTYRDFDEQNRLYAFGRTVLTDHGKKVGKVTNAKAGQSAHNFRLALDVVPMRAGKPVWATTGADGVLWNKLGAIAESVGFEWGGRWTTLKDLPHLQFLGGRPLSYYQAGGHL